MNHNDLRRWMRGSALRKSARKFVQRMGYDIVRLDYSPREGLAGLRNRSFGTVIDCGANLGQFARFISKYFPHAALHCFEPLDEPFRELAAWSATQQGRVRCYQAALGEQEGEVVMHQHSSHLGSSSLLSTTALSDQMLPETRRQSEVTVRQTTLDNVLGDLLDDMAPQILLKLDVQGYEDRVLRGASKILQRAEACMLEVNVDPLFVGQAEFKDIVALLDQHGLAYAGNFDQSYAKDGRVTWLDALFFRR